MCSERDVRADARHERQRGRRVRASAYVVALGLAWAAVVTVGTRTLWSYSLTEGTAAIAPATWPHGSRIARVDGRATLLLVFAHPRCPCTKATISELAKVM